MDGLRIGAALAVVLAVAGVARAQDVAPVASESASALFARVVNEARRTGAIERVLGVHPLIMTRHFYDDAGVEQGHRRFLMTYDISLDEVAEELRLEALVLPEGSTGRVDIGYVVGFDGRLRSMHSNAGNEELVGTVEDGTLTLSWPGIKKVTTHAWDDAILPKLVSAFVMPMLFDQGLPEVWSFRDLNPFGALTRPIEQRPLAGPEGVRVVGTFEGRARETTRVHVRVGGEAHGRLDRLETESEVNEKGAVIHLAASERIAPEEFERLRPSWQPTPAPPEGGQ